MSCGNPPQAKTTPWRTWTSKFLPSCLTMAPVTLPPSVIKSIKGEDNQTSMSKSMAAFANRPANALPLVKVMPRPWVNTSNKCLPNRLATKKNDSQDLKARKKCQSSLPEPNIIPKTVSSGTGGAKYLIRSPNSLASYGRVTMERPPGKPPGASA